MTAPHGPDDVVNRVDQLVLRFRGCLELGRVAAALHIGEPAGETVAASCSLDGQRENEPHMIALGHFAAQRVPKRRVRVVDSHKPIDGRQSRSRVESQSPGLLQRHSSSCPDGSRQTGVRCLVGDVGEEQWIAGRERVHTACAPEVPHHTDGGDADRGQHPEARTQR